MDQGAPDNTAHEGVERLFRRTVEGKAVFHVSSFLAGFVGLFLDPPGWTWHVAIVLLVYGFAKLLQDVNARRYAVAVGDRYLRLFPAPHNQESVVLAQELTSVFFRRVSFLQYLAAWTLVWSTLFVTFHLYPAGIPAWAMRMSTFSGPLTITLAIVLPWLLRMMSSISRVLAVIGTSLAINMVAQTGSFIWGGAAIGATATLLWILHRARFWPLFRSLSKVRSIGGVGVVELPLEMQPKFALAQLMTGGGLVVLWRRDGNIVAHPFEPDPDQEEEFARLLKSIVPYSQMSYTQSEEILRGVTTSVKDAQRGRLSATITKCRTSLQQCEASGAIDLAIHVADVLVEHLITTGRGFEAVALAERYQKTAKDCGRWFTPAIFRNAAAIVWASYGYFNRAQECIWGRRSRSLPGELRTSSLEVGRRYLALFVVAETLNNLGMCYLRHAGVLYNQGRLWSAQRCAALSRRLFHRARRLKWWGRWLSLEHQLSWETSLANEPEALRFQAEVVHAAYQSQGNKAEPDPSDSLYREAARLYTAWLCHSRRSSTAGGDQLSGAGLAFAAVGKFDKGEECLRGAIGVAQAHPEDVYHLFAAHKRYGDYLLSRGHPRSSHLHYERAMSVLEQCPLFQTEAVTRYYGAWERSELFANAIKAAIKLEDHEIAFLDAERSRQEGFRQIVHGSIHPGRPLSAEDEERIGRMLDEILAEQNSQSPTNGHPSTAGAADQSLGQKPSRQPDETEWDFEGMAANVAARVPSFAEIAAAVPEGSAVVIYHIVDETLYAFCLVGGGRPSKPKELVPTQDLENLLVYDEYVHDPTQVKKLGSQLYQLLLKPLLPQLDGVTRLYVVPTRPLLDVPFAALRDEDDQGRLLIAKDGRFPHGIAYLPCVTPHPVLVSAPEAFHRLDTVFRMAAGFPKVQREARVEVVEGNLLPEEILRKLGASRQVFFYTHGWSCQGAPLLSGLSRTPEPKDPKSILLTGMHCLLSAPNGRATDVVIPCSTAVMKAEEVQVSGGEEMLGFVRPLLRHAEIVIGCLWNVEIEDYVAFSQFLMKRAATNGIVDPIQAIVDWQQERFARCKKPWEEARNWAWPMVWTTLQTASTATTADMRQ